MTSGSRPDRAEHRRDPVTAAPRPDGLQLVREDHFDAEALAPDTWLPSYLPAWSSRAASAATFAIGDSCLRLSVPPAQGIWLAGEHDPPLRVSGIQSGNFSGPVGSTVGQQPWRPGALVREEQAEFWGWTPHCGYLEMRARARISPRSMFAWWLVGLETAPDRCAEICVVEVFGDAIASADSDARGASAAIGMGLHAFRDPNVAEDFTAVRRPIDVAQFHVYAASWRPGRVDFFVDGEWARACLDPPTYPMQHMIAVFDFPDRTSGTDADLVPELVVDYIREYRY